jgi:uncharacterized membrane protein YcaP (DUF421 family)
MQTIIKAAAAYAVLLFLLRITGRRTGKRMATFEILLIFLLGGQMTQSVIGEDRSFTNALTGVSTVALCHAFVSWLKIKSSLAARIIDGTPLQIYENGRWERDHMNMVRVQKQDVHQHAREEGIEREDEIKMIFVERNGAISIIKKSDS